MWTGRFARRCHVVHVPQTGRTMGQNISIVTSVCTSHALHRTPHVEVELDGQRDGVDGPGAGQGGAAGGGGRHDQVQRPGIAALALRKVVDSCIHIFNNLGMQHMRHDQVQRLGVAALALHRDAKWLKNRLINKLRHMPLRELCRRSMR